MQPIPQMPAASLLLPLLARLLHLIPSVLALRPALLRPPPLTPHCSPLTPSSRPPVAVGRSPFVVSPSASSGQALSNHERPLHRPAYPNLLALSPPYRRPPVFRLWTPTRPNRGPADPAPRQPDTQKSAKSRARWPGSPLGGAGASGREYPKNPHRNHRRLPLACRWKPASSLTPACTPTAPHASLRRPRRACPEPAEGACPEPAEGESSLRPPTPCSTRQDAPRAASRVFWKKLLRAQDHPKPPPPHPTDPSPRLSASAART